MYLDIVPVNSERRQLVEDQILLRFALCDLEKERRIADLGPLLFLLFESSGRRQKQGWADQVDENVYQVAFRTPRPGRSYLFFACPKSGVWYAQLPHLILHATEDEVSVHRMSPAPPDTDQVC
jgi:hypothetical protein